MADERVKRAAPPTRPPQGSPPARQPGWKVTPAPDGRGGKKPAAPGRGPNPRWLVITLVVGLLALNLWISSQALQPNSRVRIPYSPTFLEQVTSHNVQDITSTNDAIQGTFNHAVKYPPSDKNAQATTNFSTQVPSFANGTDLFNLLKSNGVT